ncbi:hypothetical protein EST38_g3543 [Candolleomyces aberdarensis]|uniref:Uncharacterized protein n=1 Tax=Candolleomyces aberdarensis TaxID=2316362 RepID=A0A4Q2DQE0_9AGAR|nr:hypothetical protein EST38_g3543 [Candolleomyces aberdarensis]
MGNLFSRHEQEKGTVSVHWVSLTNFGSHFPQSLSIAANASIMDLKLAIRSCLNSPPTLQLYKVDLIFDDTFPEQMARVILNEQNQVVGPGCVYDILQPPPKTGTGFHINIIAQDDEFYFALWKTLWLAPDRNRVPWFEWVPVERDNTSNVEVPQQVPVLRPPESMARRFRFPTEGIFLRDDVFVAIDAIVPLWDSKKRQTSKPEMSAPLVNVLRDTGEPTSATTRFQGVIATGQSGNGKSTFLQVLLILVLHARLPVIFQSEPDAVVLFDERGVHITPSSQIFHFILSYGTRDSRVWALVDSSPSLNAPAPELYEDHMQPVFIVQTPSPRWESMHWVSKTPVLAFVFKPWPLEELITARFLQILSPPENQIVAIFNRFRPCPRDLYNDLNDPHGDSYRQEIERAIPLTIELLDSMFCAAAGRNFDMKTHLLLTIQPSSDNKWSKSSTYKVNISSREIFKMIHNRLRLSEDLEADRLYQLFTTPLICNTLENPAGLLLEDKIHRVLPRGGSWPLRHLLPASGGGGSSAAHYTAGNTSHSMAPFNLSSSELYVRINRLGWAISPTRNRGRKGSSSSIRIFEIDSSKLPETLTTGYYIYPEAFFNCSHRKSSFDAFIYNGRTREVLVLQVIVGFNGTISEDDLRIFENRPEGIDIPRAPENAGKFSNESRLPEPPAPPAAAPAPTASPIKRNTKEPKEPPKEPKEKKPKLVKAEAPSSKVNTEGSSKAKAKETVPKTRAKAAREPSEIKTRAKSQAAPATEGTKGKGKQRAAAKPKEIVETQETVEEPVKETAVEKKMEVVEEPAEEEGEAISWGDDDIDMGEIGAAGEEEMVEDQEDIAEEEEESD